RLQVEHPVTELVTGIDLVEQQFLIAAGEPASFSPQDVRHDGHALEFRVYAEDPVRFLPSPGAITQWEQPAGPGIRVDAGYEAGNRAPPFSDPLLAKLCVHAKPGDQALGLAREAVAAFRLAGPKTNLPFHADLLTSEAFVSGDYDTSVVAGLRPPPPGRHNDGGGRPGPRLAPPRAGTRLAAHHPPHTPQLPTTPHHS